MLLNRPLVLYLCGQLILNIRILARNEALRGELLDVLGERPGAVIVHQLGGCHLFLALGYVHFEEHFLRLLLQHLLLLLDVCGRHLIGRLGQTLQLLGDAISAQGPGLHLLLLLKRFRLQLHLVDMKRVGQAHSCQLVLGVLSLGHLAVVVETSCIIAVLDHDDEGEVLVIIIGGALRVHVQLGHRLLIQLHLLEAVRITYGLLRGHQAAGRDAVLDGRGLPQYRLRQVICVVSSPAER